MVSVLELLRGDPDVYHVVGLFLVDSLSWLHLHVLPFQGHGFDRLYELGLMMV